MSDAAFISIEYAMSINDFHLYATLGYPPKFFDCFLFTHLKKLEHPFLIFLGKRNGCFTMAAKTATGALKYFLHYCR